MLDLKNKTLDNFKAVLFDLDGTLIDSERIHALSIQKILKREGLDIAASEIENDFLGLPDNLVYEKIYIEKCYPFKKTPLIQTEHDFVSLKNSYCIEFIETMDEEHFKELLQKNLYSFLETLKSKSLKCGVVSASESEVVQSTLKRADILHFFDSVTPRLSNGPNKPHPYPYQMAMKKLKVLPSETLIFEDSPTGLKAAKSSGAVVIKVENFI